MLTLVKFVLRWRLAAEQILLARLFAENPQRAKALCTSERLLKRLP